MNKLMWKLWYKFQYFWNWGMGSSTPTRLPEVPLEDQHKQWQEDFLRQHDDILTEIGIGEEIYEELLDPEEYAKFKENN